MNSKPDPILTTQATRWYVRLHAADCSAAERHAFQQWLEAAPSHEQAYQVVVSTADQVTQHMSLDPRLQALAAKALGKSSLSRSTGFKSALHNHWRRAAVVLLGVGAATLMASKVAHQPAVSNPMASYVNNETRERQIKLSDGSTLHLDVGAEVSVIMSSQERHLELAKGRAYFEVAHDETRPFSVTAAGTRTVALGTRFEVALLSEAVKISLAEGSVAITGTTIPDKWREVLSPGEQVQIQPDHEQRVRFKIDADAIASWSRGRLVFDGMPLSQVLDEINRYASIKVHLGDPKLANIPIGGNFVAGSDSNEFVETLVAVLPLRSVRTGANEIVLFQRYENHNP